MKTELIDYQENGTDLQGYLAYDAKHNHKRPAVLIGHDWTGRYQFTEDKAEYLASLGYVGFALDIYGKGITGADNDEKSKLMQPFTEDRGLLLRRLEAALESVKNIDAVDPSRIAIMGYCFGGMCALDLARSGADIRGAISLHGAYTAPDLPKQKISAGVLAIHGYEDPVCPADSAKILADELTEAECDWQIHVLGNTFHSFTNPAANSPELGLIYSKLADDRSDRLVRDFLAECFK